MTDLGVVAEDGYRREVVRAFGSNQCHVAAVRDRETEMVEIFGSPAAAVAPPLPTACGRVLGRGPIIVMRHADVGCRQCARLTGITRADRDEPATT